MFTWLKVQFADWLIYLGNKCLRLGYKYYTAQGIGQLADDLYVRDTLKKVEEAREAKKSLADFRQVAKEIEIEITTQVNAEYNGLKSEEEQEEIIHKLVNLALTSYYTNKKRIMHDQ